jgi:four helix bundle protein
MTEAEFKARTKDFAHRAVRLAEALPRSGLGQVVSMQLIRAATSAAANYRSACRSRSAPDFRNKLSIAEEECDEAAFWIEFARDHGLIKSDRVDDLLKEANEILAMLVSSRRTSSRRG